ncbi:DUF1918 domain-containing protein [Amycolatopsis japonica]|uniref:DUF1918 domain-containing protein n=1 Tax=Amycolatopsis japonica TaxID=208439 RepID=UPI00340A72F1
MRSSLTDARGGALRAQRGDWLVIKGSTLGKPDQRGLIIEVRSSDGTPPYVVRWMEDDHVSMVFPGPDAVIITEAEQSAAAASRTRSACGRTKGHRHRAAVVSLTDVASPISREYAAPTNRPECLRVRDCECVPLRGISKRLLRKAEASQA